GRDEPLRVLEVACGTGRVADQILRALPDCDYTGVDHSPYYLEVARARRPERGRVTLAAANAGAPPLPDARIAASCSLYTSPPPPRVVGDASGGATGGLPGDRGLATAERRGRAGDLPRALPAGHARAVLPRLLRRRPCRGPGRGRLRRARHRARLPLEGRQRPPPPAHLSAPCPHCSSPPSCTRASTPSKI